MLSLINVLPIHDASQRSIAEVLWTKTTSKKNVYRVGHRGKVDNNKHLFSIIILVTFQHDHNGCAMSHAVQVDLRCVEGATGRWYYPEHLPVLGELQEHKMLY